MNDDQLRDRIGRLDPLAHSDFDGASIDPITSREARSRLETVMNSPLSDVEAIDLDTRTPRRWMAISGAAAAAVAAVAIGVVAFNGGGDDAPQVADPVENTDDQQEPAKLTVLDLSAGVDDAMAMCIALDPTILAQSQVAFKGTVTSADAGVVQLTVDDAYVGVDAQAVTLSAPDGMQALIGGIEWEVGGQYLVTAWDGVVNYCGQTGPAEPELQAIFDEAFGR
jgi:hypothetical protein